MVTQKKNILHVEDDAQVATTVANLLRMEGYKVVTTYSALEGLRAVKNVKPDLIILDIGMPGMSGLTFLRQISSPEGKTKIPVLIFTAYPGMVDDITRNRVDGFLEKPTDLDTLKNEVARILSEKSPL